MAIQFLLAQPEQCNLLFRWANDREVRQNSFHGESIDYEEHVHWFERILCSEESLLYVCYHGEEAIGQVRIDLEGEMDWISYSIAREHRGKGYGTSILKNLIHILPSQKKGIQKLAGRVKHSNIPSQRAFEKAAYDFIETEEYIEYYKMLL
ncbi:MAG: GNAT family N-acetyltransferase [Thermotaleaceae bacterium]